MRHFDSWVGPAIYWHETVYWTVFNYVIETKWISLVERVG